MDKDRKRRRSSTVEEKRNMSSTHNRKDQSLLVTLRNETRNIPAEKSVTKVISTNVESEWINYLFNAL